MNRLMHSLATIWIYLNRDKYRAQLRAEYDDLLTKEQTATDLTSQLRLRRHRAMVVEELHALSLPFRLRSLWAPLPALSQRVAASSLKEMPQQNYIEAA